MLLFQALANIIRPLCHSQPMGFLTFLSSPPNTVNLIYKLAQ